MALRPAPPRVSANRLVIVSNFSSAEVGTDILKIWNEQREQDKRMIELVTRKISSRDLEHALIVIE